MPKKIYPEGLVSLLSEELKEGRINYPKSIKDLFQSYQKAHQEATGSSILTFKEVAIYFLGKAKPLIEKEIAELEKKKR